MKNYSLKTFMFLRNGCLFLLSLLFIISCNDEEGCDTPQIWYEDMDADGYGNPEMFTEDCLQPQGYVLDDSDLNDDDSFFNYTININQPASSEYKIDDQLPILINFGSRSGSSVIGNVSYTLKRKDNGKQLAGKTTQTFGSPTTYQIENNLIELSSEFLDGDSSVELELEVKVASLFNTGEAIVLKEISVSE